MLISLLSDSHFVAQPLLRFAHSRYGHCGGDGYFSLPGSLFSHPPDEGFHVVSVVDAIPVVDLPPFTRLVGKLLHERLHPGMWWPVVSYEISYSTG